MNNMVLFETVLRVKSTRFPNLVCAQDGAFVLSEGGTPTVPPPPGETVSVWRGSHGGAQWEGPVLVQQPAIQGGGMVMDETTGAMLCFCHPEHPNPRRPEPPFPATLYRSEDHGRSWFPVDLKISPDVNGHIPALHMAEHGICLKYGSRAGRLLRAARVYDGENQLGETHNGYNIALYSDDGGSSWLCSTPINDLGVGEGAVVELKDGTVVFSSRKQYFHQGQPLTWGRLESRSFDGGETWEKSVCHSVLPDGPRYRGADTRGLNFNGHFGILAGLTRVPDPARDVLLYTSPDNEGHERINLTVWASLDGGKTWPVKRRIHEGPSAYSSIIAGRPGTASEGWIACAYEGGREHVSEAVYVVRFTLDWVLQGN